MFSAFALRLRSAIVTTNVTINSKCTVTATKLGSKRHTFLNSIAYAAGLFTACPTCASYYIFGMIFHLQLLPLVHLPFQLPLLHLPTIC